MGPELPTREEHEAELLAQRPHNKQGQALCIVCGRWVEEKYMRGEVCVDCSH